jgi:hypothetical protein
LVPNILLVHNFENRVNEARQVNKNVSLQTVHVLLTW